MHRGREPRRPDRAAGLGPPAKPLLSGQDEGRDGRGEELQGEGPTGARAGIQGGEAGGAGRGARTAESPGVSPQPR